VIRGVALAQQNGAVSGRRAGIISNLWENNLKGPVSWVKNIDATACEKMCSLAIAPCVGAMSTGNGFAHRRGRNSEFYMALGLVLRTAGIPL